MKTNLLWLDSQLSAMLGKMKGASLEPFNKDDAVKRIEKILKRIKRERNDQHTGK